MYRCIVCIYIESARLCVCYIYIYTVLLALYIIQTVATYLYIYIHTQRLSQRIYNIPSIGRVYTHIHTLYIQYIAILSIGLLPYMLSLYMVILFISLHICALTLYIEPVHRGRLSVSLYLHRHYVYEVVMYNESVYMYECVCMSRGSLYI